MNGVRFTQTDPLSADVGSPYPSAYVYGGDNPLVYTDPSGLRQSQVTSVSRDCGGWFDAIGCAGISAVGGLWGFTKEGGNVIAHPVSSVKQAWKGAGIACNQYADADVTVRGLDCVVGVGATVVGADALARNLVDCLESPGAVTYRELQCMESRGLVATVTAYGVGKGVEKLPEAAQRIKDRYDSLERNERGAVGGGGRKVSRNNQVQNRQFDEAIRRAEKQLGRKIPQPERQRIHRAISGENYGMDEIVEIAVQELGG